MRYPKKIIFLIILLVPFCLGTIGYFLEGQTLLNSMYGSFVLYALGPVYDNTNAWIEIARWTAPAVLASGLLLALKDILYEIKTFFLGFRGDASAIYCDNDFGEILKNNLSHGVLIKNETVKDVKYHIIMFDEDEKSFNFYAANKDRLANQAVYIKSNTADAFKLNVDGVKFFNINEIIAANYWRDRNLTEFMTDSGINIKIAVLGFERLGQKLLSGAVLNNLYSLNQRIEYHVWGDFGLYKNLHDDLELMNGDVIVWHEDNAENAVNTIAGMDRIIITDNNIDMISALTELGADDKTDCFDPYGRIDIVYNDSRVYTFGRYEDILTEENIKTDNLYYLAKRLNYQYAVMYGGTRADTANEDAAIEAEWNKLNSFTKGSNIASANYHDIRLIIMKNRGATKVTDEMAEIEHIRWCRYHYLNHWKYAETADGKKDAAKKLHPCLVPFSDLSADNMGKDKDAINLLLKLKSKPNL